MDKKEREERNKDIVRRMKAGDPLCGTDVMESWFPIRPPIKKDKKEIERLYGKDEPKLKEVGKDG